MSHMTQDTLRARWPQDDNGNQLTTYNFKTAQKPTTQTAKVSAAKAKLSAAWSNRVHILLLRFFEYPVIKLHPPKQLDSTEVCHSWVNKLQWVVLHKQKNN